MLLSTRTCPKKLAHNLQSFAWSAVCRLLTLLCGAESMLYYTVQGIRADTATITINPAINPPSIPSPSLTITVSNTAVCLKQLRALATTGAGLTAASAAALAASSTRNAARAALTWEAQQQLVWEDSSALVLSYASFSDGSVMDVSGGAQVTAVVPAGGVSPVLPFNLLTDNSTQQSYVQVNSTVSCSSREPWFNLGLTL